MKQLTNASARAKITRAYWKAPLLPLTLIAACLATAGHAQVTTQAAPTAASAGTEPGTARFGRTRKPRDPAFQAVYDYRRDAKMLGDAVFYDQVEIHKAHTVMLAEQGIITPTDAGSILAGMTAVNAMAAKDPGLRSYISYETALIKTVGLAAGKINTGRSRNDMGNAEKRMFYRDQVNLLVGSLIEFREALVAKAAENVDTIMVVYTQRKQAQPITLGHYLMAHAEAVGKSIQRYEDLYKRLNLNPLGSGATASTGFPLNRQRTTELLGFDGIIVNSIEGVAAWDHVAELASANAIHMSNLARLSSEIGNWQTDEVNAVTLDDSFAGTSSIMPQKRNPDSIEYVKLASAETVGVLAGVLASLNAIEYQYSNDMAPVDPRSIDSVLVSTRVMTGVVKTMEPNKAGMLKAVTEGFTTMTELADTLVRKANLPFREAHEIIAHVVDSAIQQRLTANQITLAMIQEASTTRLGHGVPLTEQDVKESLDPRINVSRRKVEGGPAPSAVNKMIESTRSDIAQQRSRLQIRVEKIQNAKTKLNGLVLVAIGTGKR